MFDIFNFLAYCLIPLVLILLLYANTKIRRYTFFKKYNYDGPNPSLLKLGNLTEFNYNNNSSKNNISLPHYSKTLYKWSSKYGKIYGYYEVTKPVLVIADADLVKQIFIDNKLQYRRSFPMSKKSDEKDADLFINNGKRWQRVRKCLEKMFLCKTNLSASNKYLDSSFKSVFSDIVSQTTQSRVDIYRKVKSVLVQTMFQLIFGMKLSQHYELNNGHHINNAHESNDNISINKKLSEDLVEKFDHAFIDFESASILKICSLIFEELDCLWRFIDKIKTYLYLRFGFKYMENPLSWFLKHFTIIQYKNMFNEKKAVNKHYRLFNLVQSNRFHKCYLTSDEVISNATLLMFAGFETTSTAIAFAYHVIAINKEERKKMIEEIIECLVKSNNNNNDSGENDINRELPFELIDKLKYLDLFVREVLRMYPIANSMVSRKCVQDDLHIGKCSEHFIPKGVNIVVDVLSIHYDRELWGPVDPFVFYPNRFLENRHPAAWLAFGNSVSGRKCLGIKMALKHIKIALVRLLERYVVEPEIVNHNVGTSRQNLFNSIQTKEILFNVPSDQLVLLIRHLKNSSDIDTV